MTPVVQFDPASLSIWTCTGSLDRHADLAHAAMRAAAQGGDPYDELASLDEDDPMFQRLMWLASCVWHEKRHFFDTLLTNYGALRFRNLFTIGMNVGSMLGQLRERGEPVWFPIELYDNPLRRRILGVPEPTPDILRVARHMRQMKAYVAQIDAAPGDGTRVAHVGAEAQLEGLAQCSQIHAIEYHYGVAGVQRIAADHVMALPVEGPYRAIESVAGALGCSRRLDNNVIVVNPALAAALYVTALCTRHLNPGQEPDPGLVSPWGRLARLIELLGPSAGHVGIQDEEAMAIADKAARKLWGRTAVEEIEADIDLAEEKFNRSVPASGGSTHGQVFAEYSALRRRALERVRSLGAHSLLPRQQPPLWLGLLQPWHLVATPQSSAPGSDGGEPLQGATLDLPEQARALFASSISWSSVFRANPLQEGAFGLQDPGWTDLLQVFGPLAHLGLVGRRGRLMVPPALEQQIREIEDGGVPVRFDPMFEWPEMRSREACAEEALALARFSGRDDFVCDVTGDRIAAHQAAVLTPWELRRSPLVDRVRDGSLAAEILLASNWSDWVVRRDLLS
jgi:hypothetical protein